MLNLSIFQNCKHYIDKYLLFICYKSEIERAARQKNIGQKKGRGKPKKNILTVIKSDYCQ